MAGYRIPTRLGPRVGAKFMLMLGLLVSCLVATAWVGASAQERMRAEAADLYAENIRDLQRIATLSAELTQASEIALQVIPTTDGDRLAQLRTRLYEHIVPEVDRQIAAVRSDATTAREAAFADQISADWHRFKQLLTSPTFLSRLAGATEDAADNRLAEEVTTTLNQTTATVETAHAALATEADATYAQIEDEYQSTRRTLALIVAGALIAGVGSVLALIHNVVPRIRSYSSFAADVATGQLSARLNPVGSDELSDLGRALNQMVDRRVAERAYEGSQAEFSTALQVTENEDEAHDLLKRHLERTVPGASTVVLNRNNSANRLQATTALPEDGALAARLSGVAPRACLAIRFARPHDETPGHESLLPCDICADSSTSSRCQPLLIGGEVIGSVLVQRPDLTATDQQRINESVTHAAPVLANLRNLALAEHRALTDALTGLPNQRASHDTILRMAAQASRSLQPLAVVLLDLDHFKQVNDLYGHDKGDEVLAAVGATLASSVRTSDFAGRYGGEEFILLLPDTSSHDAVTVAEYLRTAISAVTIPNIDRKFTASFGVAVLPDHAGDAVTVLRQADRALYAAKAAGRNRIELVVETGTDVRMSRKDSEPSGRL
jgi:diguanylate cyclase (GGDEF)-like protein